MGERGNNFYRNLDRYLGIPLAMLAGSLRKKDKNSLDPRDVDKIGILCLGAIGDLLLTSALVNGFASRLPGVSIEIVSSRANSCALELLGNVDSRKAFAVKKPWDLVNYVRSRQYDLFVDTTQWARLGALVSTFSGARYTIGFDTPGQHRGCGYDIKVQHRKDRHEIDNFIALGQAVFVDFKGEPGLLVPKIISKSIERSKVIYLHMWPASGKGCSLKKWPEEHWAMLARIILDKGFYVYLTGSEFDAPANKAFINKYFDGATPISSIAGDFSLAELAFLLKNASALVSVNTGIMHLGALVGAPTIGLHGATNPLRWGPVGPRCISLVPRKGMFGYLNLGFEYPPGAQSAMQWLPVDDVIKALENLGVKI